MAQNQPEQSPNKKSLSELIEFHTAAKGWTLGRLASECGINRSTISRIIHQNGTRGNLHCPTMKSIMLISRALRLNEEATRELFYAAFPYLEVWEDAIQKNLSLVDTDIALEQEGLPLLTKEEG